MIKKWLYLSLAFLGILTAAPAQQSGEILMEIGGRKITTDEFQRMYTKNLDLVQDPKQKDIDYYKELFINYQLQLTDALEKNYDQDPAFQKEFQRYRSELARKYLSDPELQEKLVREAYERMQKDVRVSHVMIGMPSHPTPADTLKAYRKARDVYEKIRQGMPFEKAVAEYSDDPSAAKNKGDIGWFTVFQTVYPFETAAYETPQGQISEPFRTPYGYHIIRKEGERPAFYKRQVAQIAILKNKHPQDAEKIIRDIYRQLTDGKESFENLARQYSEDTKTAAKGGIMPPFGVREMLPEFEAQAYALQQEGDISEPFETPQAWHILKLIKKYPIPTFDEARRQLESQVAKSDRGQLARERLARQLRDKFTVEQVGSLEPVYQLIDRDFFVRQWKYPKDFALLDRPLAKINKDEIVTYRDFINYLYHHQVNDPDAFSRKKAVVDDLYRQFIDRQLLKYYENHLEDYYPDFARTMQEYYDGLLLFNYKTKEIWEKALQDTTGLEQFYLKNREKYRQREQARVVIVRTDDKKLAKKIYKALKKGEKLETLMQLAGDKARVQVKIMDKNAALQYLNGKKIRKTRQNGKYIVEGIAGIIPERIPPLKEIRGKVISDYQQYLEQQLLEQLKTKYPVRINEANWEKIRAKYKS